jgi:hypothetical protein
VLVVGAFMPPPPPGQEITVDRLNRIWADVAGPYGFTQLQMAPDQAGAIFVGSTPDDGVTIQAPLLQVRLQIRTTAQQAADQAASLLGVLARHLGLAQLFNLGIKHVYQAPLDTNDGRGFVRRQIGGEATDELAEGGELWAGLKFVVTHPDRVYTLIIEPLQADEMRSLFIDLDVQFPGPFTIDSVLGRAADAQSYVAGAVGRYLDAVGGQ